MNLFILRHGEAQAFAGHDSQRQLTERGRDDVLAVAERHSEKLKTITNLYASPYVRAQQTATIVANHLSFSPLQTLECITPNDSSIDVVRFLCKQPEDSSILLVSHQPLVTYLIADLCDVSHSSISMHTAALASIQLDIVASGMGELQFID